MSRGGRGRRAGSGNESRRVGRAGSGNESRREAGRAATGGNEAGRVIKRIKEGGPAAQSRRLAVGDRVLSVDEVLTESEESLRARGD